MDDKLKNILLKGKTNFSENQKILQRLKKKTPKNLDVLMQQTHQVVFEKIDCLTCANCCKTTSPIVTEKDIERIAKYLKIKEIEFIQQYLYKDKDDGLWAFKTTPCPFLDLENYCLIYDNRPKACAEYPHTNRRKFIQIADLTLKNTEICPAVVSILEIVKREI